MFSVPLQLPLKASEAASLAGLVFQQVKGRKLDDDLRSRLGVRVQALRLSSIAPFAGSLQQDPIHPDTYYVAVDTRADRPECWLLRLALASSPSSGLFPNSVLIGRMRTHAGHEVVVNAIPFGLGDRPNIRKFAERVDPAFLPKPLGAAPSISVQHSDPQASLPGTFEAYRNVLRSTGTNFAAIPVEDENQVDGVLWAAIRAGWREGYTIEADAEPPKPAVVGATRYSMPVTGFETVGEQIREGARGKFDVELVFDSASSTPEAIAASLRSFKLRGRLVQFVRPDPGASDQFRSIAEIARQHGALLAVRSIGLLPAEILQQIGRATAGKVSYHVSLPASHEPARIIAMALEHLRG